MARRKATGFRARLGRCYELAGLGLPPNPHAWVEVAVAGEPRVFDAVIGEYFPAEVYQQLYSAVAVARYSFRDMARCTVEFGHWGPWHEDAQKGG